MSKLTSIGIVMFLGGTLASLFLEGDFEVLSLIIAILGLVIVFTVKKRRDKIIKKDIIEGEKAKLKEEELEEELKEGRRK